MLHLCCYSFIDNDNDVAACCCGSKINNKNSSSNNQSEMIIPIKVPKGRGEDDNSSSMEKIEWVMLELNGELVKPQHEATTTHTEQNDIDKRRVEFGSVQFDDAVSKDLCATFVMKELHLLYSNFTSYSHETI